MAFTDQIIGAESGGDPNARNPRSSASGLGQFIDSTWLAMLQKHRPDIQGTPEQLIALKSDPTLSREMTDAYAKDNGAILSGAGLPVNAGTTYLAHFAGPQGAVSVLQADPSTPVGQILDPRAMAANPFLKGMTAGDLTAWAGRKMGGAQQPAPQQPAPASPAAPSGGILAQQQGGLLGGETASAQPQASGLLAGIQPAGNPQQQPGIFAGNAPQPAIYADDAPQLQAVPPLQLAAMRGLAPPDQPPPLIAPQRRPIDLSRLRAAFLRG